MRGRREGEGEGGPNQSHWLALRKSAYVVVFHKIFPPRTSEWIIFINLFVDNYLVNGVTNVYVTLEHHVMFFNVKNRNYHIWGRLSKQTIILRAILFNLPGPWLIWFSGLTGGGVTDMTVSTSDDETKLGLPSLSFIQDCFLSRVIRMENLLWVSIRYC